MASVAAEDHVAEDLRKWKSREVRRAKRKGERSSKKISYLFSISKMTESPCCCESEGDAPNFEIKSASNYLFYFILFLFRSEVLKFAFGVQLWIRVENMMKMKTFSFSILSLRNKNRSIGR